MPVRRVIASAIVLAGFLGSRAAPAPRAVGGVQPKPRVAVAIVIDQFAAWVAEQRLEKLPAGGGFARLRAEGTWVKRLEYEHAITETAPGHAALFTGKAPRENGIVANTVWRGDLGRNASLLEDKEARLASFDPQQDRMFGVLGISMKKLRIDTIADELTKRSGGACVVSVSMKDRGAVFGGGHRRPGQPGAIVWYDEDTGRLVTSTAFADALPAWAEKFKSTPRYWLWELTPAEESFLDDRAKSMEATADGQDGESVDMSGATFPHLAKGPKAYRATPDADRLVVDLTLAAIEHRCDAAADKAECARRPTLVSVSLSANDYIGHRFGPDSWEAWDELLRLDAELKRFLDRLDGQFGRDGYSVLLTGDHGIPRLPEIGRLKESSCGPSSPYQFPCQPGVRLSAAALLQKLQSALKAAEGVGIVRDVVDSLVYLRDDARGFVQRNPEVDALIRSTLSAQPGVEEVFRISDFKSGCGADPDADAKQAIRRLVCESVVADDSGEYGDYYIVPAPGCFFVAPPDVVSHGTPYLYDRAVPLLVRYPRGQGKETIPEARITSFHASLWYALTGERTENVIGSGVWN
jgi:type I phosphodiesterase/nucleotide pyrophosphatase